MSDQASAASSRPAALRWRRKMAGVGGVGFVALAAALVAPYAFNATTLLEDIDGQLRATIGLKIAAAGSVRFDLLPRPHIVAKTVHVSAPSGTLTIDASALLGNVRLLPLIVGRVELTGVTLLKPQLVIDLDGRPMPTDSAIGRAMHALSPVGTESEGSFGAVTLLDGTAVLKSRHMAHPPIFEAVNVTIDWPSLDSGATLTGSVEVRQTPADVAAWISQPNGLMHGDHSAMTLNIHSTALDLAASGDLATSGATTFHGRLSVAAPSAARLITAADVDLPSPAPFADLALSSDATVTIDDVGHGTVDLPNLHLHVDDNDYEGTLAFQSGVQPLISGTLASDQLNLAPFLMTLPPLIGPDRQWAQAPIGVSNGRPVALDLRMSASHLRLSSYTIDDAALAVMTRDDRIDVGLIDGKIYGGTVNGHVSFGQAAGGVDGVNMRGAASLIDVDAASLSWDVFGRQLMGGTLSGSINVETEGATAAALVAGLQGSAKADLRDGELSTVDLGRALRADAATGRSAIGPALETGRTPVETFGLALRVVDGLATIETAAMRGSDADLAVTGQIDLSHRGLNLTAIASSPRSPSRTAAFDVAGAFGKIIVQPASKGAPNRSP